MYPTINSRTFAITPTCILSWTDALPPPRNTACVECIFPDNRIGTWHVWFCHTACNFHDNVGFHACTQVFNTVLQTIGHRPHRSRFRWRQDRLFLSFILKNVHALEFGPGPRDCKFVRGLLAFGSMFEASSTAWITMHPSDAKRWTNEMHFFVCFWNSRLESRGVAKTKSKGKTHTFSFKMSVNVAPRQKRSCLDRRSIN